MSERQRAMTPEELKARALRLPDEVLTQGDLAVVDEIIAADCRFHSPEPFVPGSGSLKGWVASLRRAFPDLCAIVDEEIAEGSTVAQRLTLNGTQEGRYLGIPATRERATWQLILIQRARPDGRFVEVRFVVDYLQLLTQLGASPTAKATPQGTGPNTEGTE
jgi:hypothetical protein